MKLRNRLLLYIISSMTLATFLYYGIFYLFVYYSYRNMEEEEAKKNLHRCQAALQRELEQLNIFSGDWAAWDDTYEFINNPDNDYVKSNLSKITFTDNHLVLIYYYNNNRKPVWGKFFQGDYHTPVSEPILQNPESTDLATLLQHDSVNHYTQGLIRLGGLNLMLVSYPIVTTEKKGPVRGSLLMARLLGDDAIDRLRQQTDVDLKIWSIDQTPLPAKQNAILTRLTSPEMIELEWASSSVLNAYTVLNDIFGKPLLLLETVTPRHISAQGRKTIHYTLGFLLAFATIIITVFIRMTDRLVTKPLEQLTQSVLTIGKTADLSLPVAMDRNDEMGVLSREFDSMNHQLYEAQRRLLDQSYYAGMSELATEILHNVGNVLTSINTSVNLVEEKLEQSSIKTLPKAVDLLNEHKNDLADFLTNDPKGQRLLDYFNSLVEQTEVELLILEENIESLQKNLDHSQTIMRLQQDHAKAPGFTERISLEELVENAIKINEHVLAREAIVVERNYEPLPPMLAEKHRIQMILINLTRNAIAALMEKKNGDRTILYRIYRQSPLSVCIEVKDTGIGIANENLSNIFSYGFTTKEHGHGFGLHSSANAAAAMGGKLKVASEGIGKGASFILEFPIEPKTNE